MIYFFTSTRKCDNLSQVTIFSSSVTRAIIIASKYFTKKGYKGKPQLLAV